MEEKRQNISLHIYDRNIHVSIPKNEEEQWRKAALLINERLNAYFDMYKNYRDTTEIIYYAMIEIALKYISESERNNLSEIKDILTQLSSEVDEALK